MLTESRLPSSQEAGENRDGNLVPRGSHFVRERQAVLTCKSCVTNEPHRFEAGPFEIESLSQGEREGAVLFEGFCGMWWKE
jgi:hypothetical protein